MSCAMAKDQMGKAGRAGYRAPLRLILPTKIGYKSAKYLTSLTVTNVLERAHEA